MISKLDFNGVRMKVKEVTLEGSEGIKEGQGAITEEGKPPIIIHTETKMQRMMVKAMKRLIKILKNKQLKSNMLKSKIFNKKIIYKFMRRDLSHLIGNFQKKIREIQDFVN